MRTVEDELWSRVKDKQKAVRVARKPLQDGNALGARKRPPYLFSGLIKCGVCGGGCSMISATHYGCSTARNKGTCDKGDIVGILSFASAKKELPATAVRGRQVPVVAGVGFEPTTFRF